ncbi:hypothetical protein N234_23905 [Ralstonia pickettii DTP0602]|nr:hypothetical protein N234_23905 [Ralstonia pickettii DTP0602]
MPIQRASGLNQSSSNFARCGCDDGDPGTTELALMEAMPEATDIKYVLGLQESVVFIGGRTQMLDSHNSDRGLERWTSPQSNWEPAPIRNPLIFFTTFGQW